MELEDDDQEYPDEMPVEFGIAARKALRYMQWLQRVPSPEELHDRIPEMSLDWAVGMYLQLIDMHPGQIWYCFVD